MKRFNLTLFLMPVAVAVGLVLFNQQAACQEIPKSGTSLPEDVNKIVTFSCTPCHTKDGGLLSRAKLNFSEWTNYTAEKQKEKAAKIYAEVSKGSMPPKKAREQKPEIIPSVEQMEIIKKWAESFPAVNK